MLVLYVKLNISKFLRIFLKFLILFKLIFSKLIHSLTYSNKTVLMKLISFSIFVGILISPVLMLVKCSFNFFNLKLIEKISFLLLSFFNISSLTFTHVLLCSSMLSAGMLLPQFMQLMYKSPFEFVDSFELTRFNEMFDEEKLLLLLLLLFIEEVRIKMLFELLIENGFLFKGF